MVGIGCGDSANIGQIQFGGMGAPRSWSCNIDGPMHEKTGWSNVAFFNDSGGMNGDKGDGCYPVCALAAPRRPPIRAAAGCPHVPP